MLKHLFPTMLLCFLFLFSIFSNAQVSPLKPSKYLIIDNAKIAVYESSGKQEPSVFLIHGNTSSANSMAQFMNSTFAKTFRVVALDLPGFGKSDDLETYNTKAFTSIISKTAMVMGVDKGIIAGWSLGGDLALQTSFFLPNAKGYFLFGTAPVGGAPLDAPPSFLTPAESYAGEAVLYGFVPILTRPQIRDYVNAFFRPNYSPIPNFLYEDGYRTDPDTRAAVDAAAAGLDPDFKPEVPIAQNLKVPIALIHAENDAFVRLEYLQSIEDSIPTLWTGKTVIVSDSGHALQWEYPNKFSVLLLKFISDL